MIPLLLLAWTIIASADVLPPTIECPDTHYVWGYACLRRGFTFVAWSGRMVEVHESVADEVRKLIVAQRGPDEFSDAQLARLKELVAFDPTTGAPPPQPAPVAPPPRSCGCASAPGAPRAASLYAGLVLAIVAARRRRRRD